jgi:4-hydroxy-2-oxoheptanedioate aldolase
MKWIKEKLVFNKILSGTWLSSGSSVVAEIAGLSGFDWVLVDNEHGLGDYDSMLRQLQALSATPASPIVRVRSNDVGLIKQALDAGASGIMVPWINNAEQAKLAVSYMCYPPKGIRGLTRAGRASNYGHNFDEYFNKANENILKIVQIETVKAVENIEEIAAVEGVDMLFVGPADLSLNLGITGQINDPGFREAISKIVAAGKKHNKHLGILVGSPEHLEQAVADGFNFIAKNVDIRILSKGFKAASKSFEKYEISAQ